MVSKNFFKESSNGLKMNIQELSCIGIKPNLEVQYCQRARLYTGPLCNYKCVFCYCKNHLKDTKSLEQILKEVDYYYDYGIRELDLSGGEPSIRKDFFEILDYCTSKGITPSCLSNGFKFADLEFCKETQKHGLNEVLFSLHGSNEELHDSIVQHKGAFKRIIQAIKNTKALGYRVRVNCTVTELNYKTLYDEFPKLVNSLDVFEVNLILVNNWEDNEGGKIVDLETLTNAINASIDKFKTKLVNVRYTPFCYLTEHLENCTNYAQIAYDIYDWDIACYTILPEELHKYTRTPNYMIRNQLESAKKNRIQGFFKTPECKECKFFYICDGLKKGCNAKVKPVKGPKIMDPIFFRKDFFN